MDMERYINTTARVEVDDLDWDGARTAGLTEEEFFVLTYFADIESQTVLYMRELLYTKAIRDPNVLAFLTIWNYEEFFHGHALARLMRVCGRGLETDRVALVRQKAKFSESFAALVAGIFSRLFPEDFITMFCTWGAIQELTTLNGYDGIRRHTRNPVLATLCARIIKQERVHYAWYHNMARARLARSRRSRFLTGLALRLFWSPVGVGVKSPEEAFRTFMLIFPGDEHEDFGRRVDRMVTALPGMARLTLLANYLENAAQKFGLLRTEPDAGQAA